MPNIKVNKYGKRIVARWETKGKDFLELSKDDYPRSYGYLGNGCGGGFMADSDEEAIERMEAERNNSKGYSWGQVSVLKADRPSVKRVF